MTLRVRLEIVPSGDETRVREIGRLDINNTLMKSTVGMDAYFYQVIQLDKGDVGKFRTPIIHYRSDGAWYLVRQVLNILDIQGPKS